jgi:hypothetical protein
MLVLLSYQGHGWGYRYLHGFLGNFALLAGYGWIAITSGSAPLPKYRAQGLLVMTTLMMAFSLVPFRVIQAGETVAPYREAYRLITNANADFVIVDTVDIFYGRDLVRNNPDLSNKPLIFDLINLQLQQVDELCARGSVALFDYEAAKKIGLQKNTDITDDFKQHGASMRKRLLAKCGRFLSPL